jgi:prepilin-type N-terminal cleavage/methylation domain-containing protein
MKRTRGFTLVELSIALVIVGLLTGAILGGVQMINNGKLRRQVADLHGLSTAVNTYFDKAQQAAGDANGDGFFDSDTAVWTNLETESLANRAKRSPYGTVYQFGYADSKAVTTTQRQGNYVSVNMPADIAKRLDVQLDDGTYNKGTMTCNKDFTTGGVLTVYYFLD